MVNSGDKHAIVGGSQWDYTVIRKIATATVKKGNFTANCQKWRFISIAKKF